jgi:hypothetical protein
MLGLGLNFGSSQSGSSAARMGGPTSLLLDTYTEAAAAYSLRKLKSDYTGKVLQVRRASDHVEVDVGFDSNGLLSLDSPVTNVTEESTGITQGSSTSAAKLGEFCGEARRSGGDTSYATVDSMTEASHIEVVTWYDQSGDANNATQAAAASQPKIYDRSSGLIVENGKPAVEFDGTDDVLLTGVDFLPRGTFSVVKATGLGAVFGSSGSAEYLRSGSPNSNKYHLRNNNSINFTTDTTVQSLVYAANDTTSELAVNGATALTSTTLQTDEFNDLRIGQKNPTTTVFLNGNLQEVIIYETNKSSIRADIETNINTFYSIY